MLRILLAVDGLKSVKILPLSHWKVVGEIRLATLWMEGWRCVRGGGM